MGSHLPAEDTEYLELGVKGSPKSERWEEGDICELVSGPAMHYWAISAERAIRMGSSNYLF